MTSEFIAFIIEYFLWDHYNLHALHSCMTLDDETILLSHRITEQHLNCAIPENHMCEDFSWAAGKSLETNQHSWIFPEIKLCLFSDFHFSSDYVP